MARLPTARPPREMSALLSYELELARAHYGRLPFALKHTLADHPLFNLDALAELADRLPSEVVEHNLASVGALEPGGVVPRLDASAGEIVRGIETNGCWIVLPCIPETPPYDALYGRILDELAPIVPGGRAAMRKLLGVVFVASRQSTTPSHVDPELGFLLHLRGSKRVSIGQFPTAEAEQDDLDRFHRGGHRNTDQLPVDVTHFDLEPGDGLHVPPFVPHWVEGGDEVTISLSVGFHTPSNLRRLRVNQWNAYARRVGLSPEPYGRRPARDRAKARLLNAAASTVHRIRGRS